ncbi:hypothetical protein J1N10_09390 [Carboxylicivirga sp. A043]|uniref:UPF0158 family protein n=1 Tax=Carboxylicivirga litoralis TaxID=2816963 RepID=UPI0021CB8992|nr:UPF0158 family protein [Carboxylicivirga sp. A043]MCU4156192.1 hypothetical protein [Carboxylicivirga sp. A043]
MKNTSELIERIIKLMNDNLIVYVQRQSKRVIAIPEDYDFMDFMDSDEDYERLYNEIESNPDNYYKIEPLTSRELYNVMMDFSIDQERRNSVPLVKALRTNRPMEAFMKQLNKLDADIPVAWQIYYSDRLKRIYRTRLCKEHIHFISEQCS